MKLISALIFSIFILSASENTEHLRAKVLEKVFTNISINEEIKVWCDNKAVLAQLKDNGKFKTVNNCKDATLVILSSKESMTKECENKHIFTLNYSLLSDIPTSFGAFFWKKGRPNIVIIKSRIESRDIKISNNLEDYVEEQVW